jgi:hypothetical protein
MPTNAQFAVGELVTASDANTLFTRGYTNRIINGAFVINQRGYTSGTNLASGSYGFDRWKSGFTNTALTFTAGSQSTTVTISTSGVLQQIVERENIPAGTYVLSWSGTATGRVYNSGATPPSYAASPVTVTLDGSANVVVEFTASGGTKTLGTVQLEAGTVFSPFEYRLRTQEIALCQRYHMRWPTGGVYGRLGMGVAITAGLAEYLLPYKVEPRTRLGTLSVGGSLQNSDGSAAYTVFVLTRLDVICTVGYFGVQSTTSGLTSRTPLFIEGFNSATAFIAADMEL